MHFDGFFKTEKGLVDAEDDKEKTRVQSGIYIFMALWNRLG